MTTSVAGNSTPSSSSPTTHTVDPLAQYFWIFGCFSAAGAAIFSIIGMLLMKYGFKEMQSLSVAEQKQNKFYGIPKVGFPAGNRWWFGFVLLVIAPLPMDFVALGLASASLVFPVGTAANVLFGQVVAPMYFDGEKLGRVEWAGTFLVIVGCGLTSAFGDHVSRSFTGDEILALWGQLTFLAVLLPLTLIFITSVVLTTKRFRHSIPKRLYFFCIVYIPGYLGGVQTISFKSASEMTANVAATGGNGEWGTWKPWLFVAMVIPLAVVQLKVVNIGAEFFQATKYFPAYNSALMIIVVIFGAVFFQEYESLHPVAFPIGMLLLCVGIFMLAGKDPTDSSAVAAAERSTNLELVEEEYGVLDENGVLVEKKVSTVDMEISDNVIDA
jgi:hypothetical protein